MRAGWGFWKGWAAVAAIGICLLAQGSAALGDEPVGGEELYIAANRVVGFVPLTVYVYGKIRSGTPERIELCRSEVRSFLADSRRPAEDRRADSRPGVTSQTDDCAPARIVPTPDGYDHAYEMRFNRPGTFQVRLMMLDRSGRRSMSNTVQVRAF